MFKTYLITLALWFSPLTAAATSNDLAQQQEALVATLEQIISNHLGISACEFSPADSDTAFVVQIYCPKAATSRLLGQSGAFMRSLKFSSTIFISIGNNNMISNSIGKKLKKCICVLLKKNKEY